MEETREFMWWTGVQVEERDEKEWHLLPAGNCEREEGGEGAPLLHGWDSSQAAIEQRQPSNLAGTAQPPVWGPEL